MAAKEFPEQFMWGTATASYQIEGAANTSRVPSIWDRFSHTPGKVIEGHTGDEACDHYNRFREDVQLLKSLGTKYYRFSIAWPRIHTWDGDTPVINPDGIRFYNELIDELIKNGIAPVATLYHWDLPLTVEDKLGGWSGDRKIVDLFTTYARDCFKHFGDRVKWWITLNEPWCSAVLGYEIGDHAPGITDSPGKKVYLAGHNLLLAHANAVRVYREEFHDEQKGKIGITLNISWAEAKDDTEECKKAANTDLLFELGWFADPVYFGDYPHVMKKNIGERLPSFTEEEKALIKGSSDFFGVNHYSTHYAAGFVTGTASSSYFGDRGTITEEDGKWERTDMGWAIVPSGFEKLLRYIQKRYNPTGGIIVTENGLASKEETKEAMQNDKLRLRFYKDYISAMHDAMTGEGKADVRGYFLWSFMDNFEWAFGYTKRFGLFWVDYKTQERIAKPAVEWYRKLVSSNVLE